MRPAPCLSSRLAGLILVAAGSGFSAVALQGQIVARDSLGAGVEGVVVTLASSGQSDTTDVEGAWGIGDVPVSIGARQASSRPLAGHLRLEQGRIRMDLGGRDLAGRRLSGAPDAFRSLPQAFAGRTAVDSGVDTLVYRWNGKVILRDTLSIPSQSGIVRKFDTTLNAAVVHGYLKDERDGQVYRTVLIGTQEWMAENLALAVDSSYAYSKSLTNAAVYGRLYTWATAMGLEDTCNRKACLDQIQPKHRGLCPSGWHVPDTAEAKTLNRFVEADSVVGTKNGAKAMKSTALWASGAGTDQFGFRVLPGGYRDYIDRTFLSQGSKAFFWTSHGINASMAWHFNLVASYTDVEFNTSKDKPQAISLRCLRD